MNDVSRPCLERELLLHGLADGELDAANALIMEEHLRSCSGCAATFGEIIRQKKLFKNAGLRFDASPALRDRIRGAIAAGSEEEARQAEPLLKSGWRTKPRSWFPQAGIAFSAAALAASLLLFVSSQNPAPSLDDELVAGHVRISAGFTFDRCAFFRSAYRQALVPWKARLCASRRGPVEERLSADRWSSRLYRRPGGGRDRLQTPWPCHQSLCLACWKTAGRPGNRRGVSPPELDARRLLLRRRFGPQS